MAESCKTQRFITSPEYWGPTENSQGFERFFSPGDIMVYVCLHSTLAKYTTLNYKVDFNGLVSAVGGGLGLFLGVSVLTTLKSLYSCVGRKINVTFSI